MNRIQSTTSLILALLFSFVWLNPASAAKIPVTSVQSIADLSVSLGTPRTALALPPAVDVTLSDASTRSVRVSWDKGSPTYNANQAATYAFKGTLSMPSGLSNPQKIKAAANVIVADALTLQSVSPIATINVTNGTPLANVGLPGQVQVTLNDGTTRPLSVTWNSGTPNYAATTAGQYTFAGTLTLVTGVSNPLALRATATVVVAAPTSLYIPNSDPNPRTRLNTAAGSTVAGFNALNEWQSSGSARLVLNNVNTLADAASIEWTPLAPIALPGTGHSYITALTTSPIGGAMAAIENTELGIYLPDTKNIAYMLVRFYTDDALNVFHENAIGTWELSPGWNRLRRTKAQYTFADTVGSGAPNSWDHITRMEIIVVFADTATPSATFDRFAINTAGRAKVLFTFDDAWYDAFQLGFPILEARGFKATTWAIADSSAYSDADMVGAGPKVMMSEEDLDQLYAAGWDIGNHSKTHPNNINLLSDAQIRTEYLDTQNWLLSKGWTRGAHHVCYPSGSYNERLIQILKSIGVKTARTVDFGTQPTPVTNIYKLKTVAVGRDTDMARVFREVDQAVATGSSLFFMLHRVEVTPEPDDGGANYGQIAVSTQNLRALVDYVDQYVKQGALDVVTISQWYDAYMQ